jgi:hypothetical protein
MRNANAQRINIMIPIRALQQLPRSHVSHAEIGGCVAALIVVVVSVDYDVERTSIQDLAGFRFRNSPEWHAGAGSDVLNHRTEVTKSHEGQRCALLTTKSRKTCTRATVFNSSG